MGGGNIEGITMNRTGDRGDRGSDRGAQGRGDRGRGAQPRGAQPRGAQGRGDACGNAGGFRPRGPVNEEDAEARLGRFYDAIAERYDANNNGKLEVAEIGSERLKGYDGDGDGIVTRAELSKGLTADGPRQREPAGDTDEEDAGESDAEEAAASGGEGGRGRKRCHYC